MRLFVFCCKMLCSTRLWKSSHSVFSPRASALLHMPIYPNSQCPPPLSSCSLYLPAPIPCPSLLLPVPPLLSHLPSYSASVKSLLLPTFFPNFTPTSLSVPIFFSPSCHIPFCLLFLLGCSHFLVFHLAHPLSLAVSTPSIHVPIPFSLCFHHLYSQFSPPSLLLLMHLPSPSSFPLYCCVPHSLSPWLLLSFPPYLQNISFHFTLIHRGHSSCCSTGHN